METPAQSKIRLARRRRLRVLLGIEAVVLALFAVSRIQRSQLEPFGPVAVAIHEMLVPLPDMALSRAGKRCLAEIRALGGSAYVPYRPTPLEKLLGRSELVYARFSGDSFGDDELARLVKKWSNSIGGLDLRDTRVTDSGLRHLQGLGRLDTLALGQQSFRSKTPHAPASASRITDAGLRQLRYLPQLWDLNLDGLPITDAGLANLEGLPRLDRLCVARTMVQGDRFARWKLRSQITELNLDGTPVADAGLANLAAAPRLTRLSLRGVLLSPEQLKLLEALPALNYLDLYGCPLSDEDLDGLRAARPNLMINTRSRTGWLESARY
jgi:hypothetical protein